MSRLTIFRKINHVFLLLLYVFTACKMLPASDRQFETLSSDKVYHLKLSAVAGSVYYYNIYNETATQFTLNENKTDNVNKTTLGITYTISNDAGGKYLFDMRYDKIKIYSNNAGTENEMDADNAALTANPVEKMLGVLKNADITAMVDSSGNVQSVTGYQELTAKLFENMGATDTYTRAQVQTQWEKFIKQGFVKSNLDQLLKIFPDSAVRIGDKWKLDVQQNTELNLVAKSSFLLKSISDSIATIIVSGNIQSDNKPSNIMGQEVIANMKGEQEGECTINILTGMLVTSKISAAANGTIQVMGRDIPVKVKITITVNGPKI